MSYSDRPLLVKSPRSNQVSFVDLGDFGTKYGNEISVEYAYPILEIEIDSETLNEIYRMAYSECEMTIKSLL